MAEEQEAVRCLEALHKEEERLVNSLLTIVRHNVYSCEPGELPVPVKMDQNKKLYFLMNATDRVMTPSGPSRKTPRGHWKSREGHREIIINGTAHGFKQMFRYISGEPLRENIKWAMIEYTLYPPKSKENQFALCYVYRTKQDGRQKNGRPHDIECASYQNVLHDAGRSEPLRILGSNEGGQFETFTAPLQRTDRALGCDVLIENSLHHVSLWDLPYQTCDDLDLREEHSSNDLPYETYDELDLDYNGNDFPYRLGGT